VLKNGGECRNGIAEGYRGVELIEACQKSAAGDGQIIRL
jgi:hypothetical protein